MHTHELARASEALLLSELEIYRALTACIRFACFPSACTHALITLYDFPRTFAHVRQVGTKSTTTLAP